MTSESGFLRLKDMLTACLNEHKCLSSFKELEKFLANRARRGVMVSDSRDKKGGILFVPSRKGQREQGRGRELMALQSGKGASGKEQEVKLSRAIFNGRGSKIDGAPDCRILAYEAPLLRQESGRGSRQAACDLIGISNWPGQAGYALTAIEVKCKNMVGGATGLAYGLLESWAYGYLLKCHLENRPEALRDQVVACCNWHGVDVSGANLSRPPFGVGFALLIPGWEIARGARNGRPLKEVVLNCKSLLAAVHKLVTGNGENGAAFEGYWVMQGVEEPEATDSLLEDMVVPRLRSELRVTVHKTIESLIQ